MTAVLPVCGAAKGCGHLRTTGHWWAVLFWLWGEKRVNQKQSKSIQSHSKRGQWKVGARRKDIWVTGVYPTDRLHFFSGWKTQELHCKSLCFSSSAGHPLSVVMCTFENYIYLESCNSGMSSTHVLMCQWESSTLVHNDWSDFCCAFGKCRQEITEGTSRALIEMTFFFCM